MKKWLLCAMVFLLNGCVTKHHCEAHLGNKVYQCALGQSGVSTNKHEGDGATPAGEFAIRKVFYRSDRVSGITTKLPLIAMQKNRGWCDDPHSAFYNQEVRLPFAPSHENLWREDSAYDIVAVVGYNDRPVVSNKGSAIFMHVAHDGYTPTAGCIAFSKKDLAEILKQLNPHSRIRVESNGVVYISPSPDNHALMAIKSN